MSDIQNIFPTPVYFENLKRNFTKSELDFVKKLSLTVIENQGNLKTKETYVLNEPPFKKLKKELTEMVVDYFNKIVSTKNVVPYIKLAVPIRVVQNDTLSVMASL